MTRKLITVAVLAVTAALGDVAGYAAHSTAAGPRACSAPALPSGDAMQAGNGHEYVCTDGAWIRVTHYGN